MATKRYIIIDLWKLRLGEPVSPMLHYTIFDKTFATRLLSRGAAITDVQHILDHASVKTTEKAYAAFVKNAWFKQTINLLDKPDVPKLTVVRCVARAPVRRSIGLSYPADISIAFRTTVKLWLTLSWADYTTNIVR